MPAAARTSGGPADPDDATFASLGVPAPLVAVLAETGIITPFPIQAATLPDALAGLDILGRAQTGSGKTLGFSLPLVARLTGGETEAGRPRGLVLVPTRELATQVQAVLAPLAHAMGLRVATIYGGVSQRPQVKALQHATDIVVACPGRLADLIGQGHCDLGDVEITVIDEADQMADLGFLPVIRRLLEATPADGQRLLFSATLDSAVDVLARRFLTDPAKHSVDENSSPAEIEHHVLTIEAAHRLEVVAALAGGQKRSLVFTRTKHGAQRLARQLTAAGIPAAELHGNLPQGARARNLAAFATGVAQVMVATDIAARGIHVDGVDLVIHADPPAEPKAYVHRSGRTARAGADGVVVTIQTAAQARDVRKLMREAGVTPQGAKVTPDSDVLREIAGPPVPRVRLSKPVTQQVKLPRPGAARPRSDRPRSDRPRSDRPRSDRLHPERADRRHSGKADPPAERRDERQTERFDERPRSDRPRGDQPRPARADRRDSGRRDFGRRDFGRRDFGRRDFDRAEGPASEFRARRRTRPEPASRPARDNRERADWAPRSRPTRDRARDDWSRGGHYADRQRRGDWNDGGRGWERPSASRPRPDQRSTERARDDSTRPTRGRDDWPTRDRAGGNWNRTDRRQNGWDDRRQSGWNRDDRRPAERRRPWSPADERRGERGSVDRPRGERRPGNWSAADSGRPARGGQPTRDSRPARGGHRRPAGNGGWGGGTGRAEFPRGRGRENRPNYRQSKHF